MEFFLILIVLMILSKNNGNENDDEYRPKRPHKGTAGAIYIYRRLK